ncbi:MAG: PSD1 and planctomycete cytochrome C domain-containing protein [Pirellulales bacterium]
MTAVFSSWSGRGRYCFPAVAIPLLFVAPSEVVGEEAPSSSDLAEIEFYEEQVRPILVRRCYECHSSEADSPESDLLLDRRSGWQQGGGRGPAIVPGKPAESLLLQAIGYEDADLQMPPDSKLPQAEIDTLARWIAAGAPAPDDDTTGTAKPASAEFDLESRRAAHWAWQPIERREPPEVGRTDWPRDAIDRFVRHRLEREGIASAEPADRNTWLRRVTFDLTGLPPTRQEIADFLADESATAYETVVDRLLSSTAFGECWGQHWLDVMRYAETKGHENDFPITHSWRYRDYVICAFNQNVPFDQFVREHIAGDLIWPPRVDRATGANQSIQGTAFWHLGEATHSPVDIRGDEADRIDNQIDTFGKAFLGLTIACARCHDHKFDAISTADYYALCGFLQSSSYQLANVAEPLRVEKLAQELSELHESAGAQLFALFAQRTRLRLDEFPAALVAALQRPSAADAPLRAEIERAVQDPNHPLALVADVEIAFPLREVAWVARPESAKGVAKLMPVSPLVDFSQRSDWITSGFAFGPAPVAVGDVLLRADSIQPISSIASEPAARAGTLSHKFTGYYRTPTFTIPAGKLWYRYRGKAAVFAAVDSHRTVEGPLHGVLKQQLDSAGGEAWFCHNLADYIGHRAHVEFAPQSEFELFEVRFAEVKPAKTQAANEFLLQVLHELAARDLPSSAAATAEAFRRALAAVEAGVADRGAAELVNWLLAHEDVLPPVSAGAAAAYESVAAEFVRRHTELESQIPEPVWAGAMLDANGVDEHIHLRGSHKRLDPALTQRRFLEALDGESDSQVHGSGRMQLAEQLVAVDNPLTARVFVNRVWHHLFGRGIVPTVDNFGVLGELPTHPELLDYLAAEFMGNGWDTKQLIRRMVLSSTYRMTSTADADAVARDPANRWLHSARIRRLPAEAVRDALLAVAGNLDRKAGGASVPAHITDFMRDHRSPEKSGPFDGDRRRSIYLEVRRNAMSHFLTAFDKPPPATAVGARHGSNSPAQPLILLNDPLVHQQAEVWARALIEQHPTDEERIAAAYLTAFAREPEVGEAAQIRRFLSESTSEATPRGDHIAAWKQVCLTLFNVKEFVYLR